MAARRDREKRKETRVSAKERRDKRAREGGVSTIKAPPGARFFAIRQRDEVRKIAIIPYDVPADAKNPYKEEGGLHFERTFWHHANVGPNRDRVVCPAKTADLPCPICEYLAERAKDSDLSDDERNKEWREIGAKERQLYNVFDYEEPDKGVQVWEVSFHNFGKTLEGKLDLANERNEYNYFADPRDGKVLFVSFKKDTIGSNSYWKAASLDMEPRDEPLPKEILNGGHVLDHLLVLRSYESIYALFHQVGLAEAREATGGNDEGDAMEKESADDPAEEVNANPSEELAIERGDDVMYEGLICTVLKISGDGTSLTVVDENDTVHKAVDPREVEVIRDDAGEGSGVETSSKPPKSGKGRRSKEVKKSEGDESSTPAKDDDDDWDDWD
jgi:hypothetical protein